MFILENAIIVLLAVALFFLLFTLFNLLTFTKDLTTGIFLTFIFFDLLIRMPFKAINDVYKDREKLIRKINKQSDLTDEEKKKMGRVFKKRYRLFIAFFKSSTVTYSELMNSLEKWYLKKPFKVRISVVHMNRKRFESKYLNDIRKDLLGTP